jgi:8-oxo-dGTP diphosphatase
MKYEWHPASNWNGLDPIVQVHGVCFDASGNILIIREPGKEWHLVGGKPEQGESYEETLYREVLEEANVKVNDAKMIGYQKVVRDDGLVAFQLRFVAKIQHVGPLRPDPTTGLANEREFVAPESISQYVTYKDIIPIVDEACRRLDAES